MRGDERDSDGCCDKDGELEQLRAREARHRALVPCPRPPQNRLPARCRGTRSASRLSEAVIDIIEMYRDRCERHPRSLRPATHLSAVTHRAPKMKQV